MSFSAITGTASLIVAVVAVIVLVGSRTPTFRQGPL